MNTRTRWLTTPTLWLILVLAALAVCPPTRADGDIIHISGELDEDTTWQPTNVYVVDADLTVSSGVTLTIESGTVVKFDQYADLIIEGRLALGEEPTFTHVFLPIISNGSPNGVAANEATASNDTSAETMASQPVILTSLADDSVGGDTNGDGDTTSPSTGDWGGVLFDGDSQDSSYMQAFEIRYSGVPRNGSECGAIVLENASPYLATGMFTENQINGIEIPRANWLTDIWDAKDMVYHLTDNVTVPRGNNLTIPPGTIVKVARYKRLVVEGALHVAGTADYPVIMTSWRDTEAGGATYANAEGDPEAKDWGGIEFMEESADYHSALDHVELRYTGRGLYMNTAAILLNNCSPDLESVTFVEGYLHGARLQAERDELVSLILGSQTVPYIILDDLFVPRGETLTLEPGVVLKVKRTQSIRVQGALKAQGRPWNPIILTSLYDDSAMGDTDRGGSTPAPASGDWGCVSFEPESDDSASTMSWVTLRYGGSDSLDFSTILGPLRIDNASPSLTNITLEDNRLNALSVAPGNWTSASWGNEDLVYFVDDDVTFLPGETLAIEPGVVVKILNAVAPSDQPLVTIQGTLQVGAHGAPPVIITSGRDDEAGPAQAENWDSNNDGSASAPSIDNWKGIIVTATADSTNSYLRNTVIKYGGLRGSTFLESHGALRLVGASVPLEWCQFLGNYRGVEALEGAAPSIINSSFVGNANYGILNEAPSSATVNAANNWWGDATGPSSDGEGCNTANGYGDTVSCGVTYAPWLTTAP